MRKTSLAAWLIGAIVSIPATVIADANDGEFMGYRLNDRYPMTEATRSGPSLSGNLVVIAENPVLPGDMGMVRLTTTLETHTIGFIEASQDFSDESAARDFARKYYNLLHAKYPDWRIDTGKIQLNEKTLMPTALNMDRWPHTIRMKLTETEATDGRPFRVSLTLRYLFDSPERKAWNKLARAEQSDQQQADQEKLIENADTRGL
ncbi:MAG: hypothetical protein ACN4GT_00590 [Gammaproteobacteria bacterium]